ncbi:MAG: hypothetical protein MK185_00475 [Saccharospirillaceae bacterium]|nr:hypothetical protein A3759_22755 [Thalassolituus sp. HI0120]KZZ47235.1 hypothetical protein A3759_05775 [Thalassolituus sp. HI0120]MCH2039096.1 hypothetical protein [Saccharospirillaceae bacterium]
MTLVKQILSVLLVTMAITVQANQAEVGDDIRSVKQAVLELNKELYALEEELLSPATTRAAFYFSLAYGEFFEPLSIEVKSDDFDPVQHIYTERQINALRMGAVQPLAQINMGPGNHQLRIVVRGVDHLGQNRELVINETVEKNDQPLLLEIVISDEAELKTSNARLKRW